jgi:hypothetical protein
MDCSICLAAIETGTSSATTSCGHAFHFGCLATWSKTKSTCPLCRQAFTETDTPTETVAMMDPAQRNRPWRDWFMEVPPSTEWVARLRRQLQERYTARPLEQVVLETPDPVDIAFIMEKANVDTQTARAYLAFYKDPVEVVTHVGWGGDEFPIPEFRERERPAPLEPYVSRDITHRTGTTTLTLQLYDDGYESA